MSNLDSGTVLGLLFFLAAAIFVGKYIIGWHHEIEKRNRYMEVQIKLLAEIAARNGVDDKRIKELLSDAIMPDSISESSRKQRQSFDEKFPIKE